MICFAIQKENSKLFYNLSFSDFSTPFVGKMAPTENIKLNDFYSIDKVDDAFFQLKDKYLNDDDFYIEEEENEEYDFNRHFSAKISMNFQSNNILASVFFDLSLAEDFLKLIQERIIFNIKIVTIDLSQTIMFYQIFKKHVKELVIPTAFFDIIKRQTHLFIFDNKSEAQYHLLNIFLTDLAEYNKEGLDFFLENIQFKPLDDFYLKRLKDFNLNIYKEFILKNLELN